MQQRKAGFTLIELLIVTALSIIILLGASSLFYSTIISSSHKDTITAVKQEGDSALGQMEFLLRNAIRLEVNPSAPGNPVCTTGMNSITFRGADNGVSTLALVGGQIASSSGGQTVYLTSPAVTINTQTPLFDCTQTTSGVGGYVDVHFTLGDTNTDYSAPNAVTETFTTSVNLRSF